MICTILKYCLIVNNSSCPLNFSVRDKVLPKHLVRGCDLILLMLNTLHALLFHPCAPPPNVGTIDTHMVGDQS